MFLAGGLLAWLIKAPPRPWPRCGDAPSGGRRLAFRRGRCALANRDLLHGGRRLCVWQRSGDHSVSVRRRREGIRVARRTVSGCRGGGAHHSGAGGDHGGVYWLPRRGARGRLPGGAGDISARYPLTILPAPYFKKYGKLPAIVAFVDGVTAAAIGAISGAVIVLGRRTIFGETLTPDWFKVGIMLITIGMLASGRKIPEPLIVIAAAIAGLVAYPLLR